MLTQWYGSMSRRDMLQYSDADGELEAELSAALKEYDDAEAALEAMVANAR